MSLFQTILSQVKARLEIDEKRTEEIAAVITSICGVPITPSQITITKGTLLVKVSPTAKMAVLLKKEAILNALKEKKVSVTAIG